MAKNDPPSPSRDVHEALNEPATDPDPTAWPDPDDKRPDPRDPGARPGGRIALHVDPDQIYAFEAASGRSLAGARATDGEKSVARLLRSIEVPKAPL